MCLADPSNLLLRFQRFDKSQRAKFLSALLNDLELNEAVTLSRRIEPRLRRDFLKELPLELALHAMSFVSPLLLYYRLLSVAGSVGLVVESHLTIYRLTKQGP